MRYGQWQAATGQIGLTHTPNHTHTHTHRYEHTHKALLEDGHGDELERRKIQNSMDPSRITQARTYRDLYLYNDHIQYIFIDIDYTILQANSIRLRWRWRKERKKKKKRNNVNT